MCPFLLFYSGLKSCCSLCLYNKVDKYVPNARDFDYLGLFSSSSLILKGILRFQGQVFKNKDARNFMRQLLGEL